jgi:hypothetical protein
MSSRKADTLREQKPKPGSGNNEGTVEPSSSKKAKLSTMVLIPQPMISYPEPRDDNSTGQPCVAVEMVDYLG